MRKLFLLSILALTTIFVACEQQELIFNETTDGVIESTVERTGMTGEVADAPTTRNNDIVLPASLTLYAGQNIEAGQVKITTDGVSLFVTYVTNDGWELGTTHLYAGACDNMPLTGKGNPKIGQFPYVIDVRGEDSYTFDLSLEEILNKDEDPISAATGCFCLAAHAELTKANSDDTGADEEETGWADWATEFEGNRWGGYTEICL